MWHTLRRLGVRQRDLADVTHDVFVTVYRRLDSYDPARPLRPGDLLRVTLPAGKRVVKIVALAERRGPAPSARALYDDLTPPAPPRVRMAQPAHRAPGAGRPTKRERRLLDRLRFG